MDDIVEQPYTDEVVAQPYTLDVKTLYSKIGALTVRCDLLMAENEDLRAHIANLTEDTEGIINNGD